MRLKRRIRGVIVAFLLAIAGLGIGTIATATSALADSGCSNPSAPVGTLGTADGWVVQCTDTSFGPIWYPLYPIPGSDGGSGQHHPPLQQ